MAYSSLGKDPLIISHNTKGLNIPEKRTSLLRELKRGKPHFVFLQETHFKTGQIQKLTDTYFTAAHHATNDKAKTKGVTILVSRDAPFTLTDRLIDPEGRYVVLKGTYLGKPITLGNAYFPNYRTCHLLQETYARTDGIHVRSPYTGW